jgi:hypothetical protein
MVGAVRSRWPDELPTKPATPSFIRLRRARTAARVARVARWAILVLVALALGVAVGLCARYCSEALATAVIVRARTAMHLAWS